ncbi:hypothetical protein [Allorhizocola rhizosphaerae]|uniref:hypothetical protein n=1 Tax=Allorhizocola rhizosphaerae TaxID=1872709 RepID=UPI000E3C25C9|nr:hypothetical protein [Allorhizocola rhizosphaerae]
MQARIDAVRRVVAEQQQALAHYREQASDAGIGPARGNLALINHGLGGLRDAHACARQSLAVERKAARKYGQAVNLCNLTLILSDLGEHRAGPRCTMPAGPHALPATAAFS